MMRQTDDWVNPLGKWGCYVLSIFSLTEKTTGKKFTGKEVFLMTAQSWKVGFIDDDFNVVDPGSIAKLAGASLSFIGKRPSDYQCARNEYEILEFYNPRTKFTHFVLGDGQGKVGYDPIENSVTVREGRIVGKRIFRVESK